MRTCLPHIFEDTGVKEKMDSFLSLAASIAKLMDATCDFVPWDATTSEANVRRVRRLPSTGTTPHTLVPVAPDNTWITRGQ
jgi:hypothetical protein